MVANVTQSFLYVNGRGSERLQCVRAYRVTDEEQTGEDMRRVGDEETQTSRPTGLKRRDPFFYSQIAGENRLGTMSTTSVPRASSLRGSDTFHFKKVTHLEVR